MQHSDPAYDITTPDALAALFGPVGEASIAKERDHIDAHYRALIEASPFVALASVGPDGLDCSPRGDPKGFVHVADEKTLILPDRRGNNRIDSLRNLIADPRVALLFLIPGVSETLRVNGRARISVDPQLLARHAVDGRLPKVALVITVDTVFFQCSRAVVRADLWNPDRHAARGSLPTPGQILAAATQARIDGETYDRELPARVKTTLY
ncbi:pyridoxamine 5'-phosphate oxidase family protein [Oxalobacteraceae bacterium OM1]|nr:pyridoxamine 5'-phosphate oxidase family protein [Oxalobacteraceae bacterium OM1]